MVENYAKYGVEKTGEKDGAGCISAIIAKRWRMIFFCKVTAQSKRGFLGEGVGGVQNLAKKMVSVVYTRQ